MSFDSPQQIDPPFLGKGDDSFDSQFAPGPHKVSLQVADDKHVAMPGLCTSMTINVTP